MEKTQAICIKDGLLCEDPILLCGYSINPIKTSDKIKYLGVNFEDELVFEESKLLKIIGDSIEVLVSSTLLHPHQKIAVINQFIWPKLIYSLQSVTLDKIPKSFLENINQLIRSATREMLSLPQDSPNSMLYSSSKHKGLNIINAAWEASIQCHGISISLMNVKNIYVPELRDLLSDAKLAIEKLNIPTETYQQIMKDCTTVPSINRHLREYLRMQQNEDWKKLPVHGKAVEINAHL